MNKRGYAKAVKEALIDGIRCMEQSRRAIDQFLEEKETETVNVSETHRAVGTVQPKTKTKARATENTSIFGCVTRSKSEKTQPTNIESKCDSVMRSQSKQTKSARNVKKIKNSVRRSERLRKKNIS